MGLTPLSPPLSIYLLKKIILNVTSGIELSEQAVKPGVGAGPRAVTGNQKEQVT
jgi:hypothetical protein